jgi:hypothetical protein
MVPATIVRVTRRSLWRRSVAALFAPWLMVVMAEPAALHTCAMHAGHMVRMADMAASADAGHHMDAPDADQAPGTPEHSSHHCTCLGGCCAASPVATPSAPELSWVPVEHRRGDSPIADEQRPAISAEHVLPFANGPPARA